MRTARRHYVNKSPQLPIYYIAEFLSEHKLRAKIKTEDTYTGSGCIFIPVLCGWWTLYEALVYS